MLSAIPLLSIVLLLANLVAFGAQAGFAESLFTLTLQSGGSVAFKASKRCFTFASGPNLMPWSASAWAERTSPASRASTLAWNTSFSFSGNNCAPSIMSLASSLVGCALLRAQVSPATS
jgi:hypothetical protein